MLSLSKHFLFQLNKYIQIKIKNIQNHKTLDIEYSNFNVLFLRNIR